MILISTIRLMIFLAESLGLTFAACGLMPLPSVYTLRQNLLGFVQMTACSNYFSPLSVAVLCTGSVMFGFF